MQKQTKHLQLRNIAVKLNLHFACIRFRVLTLFLMGYFMYVRLMGGGGGVQNCTPYHKIGMRKAINLIFGRMLILTPKT